MKNDSLAGTMSPKELNAEVHRKHILGQHVAEYMKTLLDDDEQAFKRQFSKFIKEGIVAENVSETMP